MKLWGVCGLQVYSRILEFYESGGTINQACHASGPRDRPGVGSLPILYYTIAPRTIFLRDLFPVCDSFGASSVARWPFNGDVYQSRVSRKKQRIATTLPGQASLPLCSWEWMASSLATDCLLSFTDTNWILTTTFLFSRKQKKKCRKGALLIKLQNLLNVMHHAD
jgi:hypothetical protein